MESLRFEFQPEPQTADAPDRSTLYKGRNGMGRCTGLEVLAVKGEEVLRLSPFNSKDAVSDSCFIEIPRTQAAIMALVRNLLSEADGLLVPGGVRVTAPVASPELRQLADVMFGATPVAEGAHHR
jgi:hypothetical protein